MKLLFLSVLIGMFSGFFIFGIALSGGGWFVVYLSLFALVSIQIVFYRSKVPSNGEFLGNYLLSIGVMILYINWSFGYQSNEWFIWISILFSLLLGCFGLFLPIRKEIEKK